MNNHSNHESIETMIAASIERDSCSESIDKIGDIDSSSLLEITVKRVGNEASALTLQVPACASVFDLKTLISEGLAAKNDAVPVERQRLIFCGRLLMDNDEILGGKAVKMRTNTINFVHLSPLPEGAKPSKRSSRRRSTTRSLHEVHVEGSPASLQRARRLGVLARERRRRRRDEPYSTDSVLSSSESRGTSERQQTTFPVSEPHPRLTLSGSRDHTINPAIAPPMLDIALGRGANPLLNSLAPSLNPFSPLAQVSQAASTVASSREIQQGLTAALRSALMERIRHASMDILPAVIHLQGQLHRINESPGLDAMEESEILDIVNTLDRVAQESGSLAVALRSMQRPPSISVLAPPSHHVLEQWLVDNMGNGTNVMPGGGALLMPGSWFTHML